MKNFNKITLLSLLFFFIFLPLNSTFGAAEEIIINIKSFDQDGYMKNSGKGLQDEKDIIRVGDAGNSSEEYHGFMGFDLAAIPISATIEEATLQFKIKSIRNNPHTQPPSPFLFDQVDFGTNLDKRDNEPIEIETNFTQFYYPNHILEGTLEPDNSVDLVVSVSIPIKRQLTNAMMNPMDWYKFGTDKWLQVRIRPSGVNNVQQDQYFDIASSKYMNTEFEYLSPKIVVKYHPPGPPDPPEEIFVAANSCDYEQMDVSWSNVFDATHFQIYRNLTENTNTATMIAEIPNITNHFIDLDFNLQTTYYYWVKTYNNYGISPFSDSAFGISSHNQMPDCPDGILCNIYVTSPANGNFLQISWNNYCNETSYILYKNTISDSTTATQIILPKNQTNYYDYFLEINTEYWYWIEAVNKYDVTGTFGEGSATTGSNEFSPIPDLHGEPLNNTYNSPFKLWWPDVMEETHYVIYRSTGNNTNTAIPLVTLASNVTNYLDLGPFDKETVYYYWIKSFNGNNAFKYSTYFSNIIRKPIGLSVKSESIINDKKIILEWNKLSRALKYRIYYSEVVVDSTNAELVAEITPDSSKYADTNSNLLYNKTYYYNVGYTLDGKHYTLDSPADKFIGIIIKANDLKFNNRIELIPRYNEVVLMDMKENPAIIGPLVSAYQVKIYKVGDLSGRVTVLEASPARSGNPNYLIDGDTSDTNKYSVNMMDSFIIFDMQTIVDITSVEIFSDAASSSSSKKKNKKKTGLQEVKISTSADAFGPWVLAREIGDEDIDPEGLYTIPEDKQKGRYVKLQPNYDGTPYTLYEVIIDSKRHEEEVTMNDISMQDKISLVLPYHDNNQNNYPELYNSLTETPQSENTLAVFYLNGLEWNYLSGKIDGDNNIIAFDTQNLGTFGIFPSKKISSEKITFSKRYLTADSDGINDCIFINVNPPDEVKLDIKIYNLSGKLVMHLVNGMYISSYYSVEWCGQSTRGEELEIGVYLYEVRFNNKKQENGILFIVR